MKYEINDSKPRQVAIGIYEVLMGDIEVSVLTPISNKWNVVRRSHTGQYFAVNQGEKITGKAKIRSLK